MISFIYKLYIYWYLPLQPPLSDGEITVLSFGSGAPVVGYHGVEVTQGTSGFTTATLLHVDINMGGGRGRDQGGGHLCCGRGRGRRSHQGVSLANDPQGLTATSLDDCPRLVLMLLLWRHHATAGQDCGLQSLVHHWFSVTESLRRTLGQAGASVQSNEDRTLQCGLTGLVYIISDGLTDWLSGSNWQFYFQQYQYFFGTWFKHLWTL